MSVIAFHGWGATPSDLRQDMGDPSWVDHYWPYEYGRRSIFEGDDTAGDMSSVAWEAGSLMRHSVTDEQHRKLLSYRRLVLVGYSLGGSLIGELSLGLPNLVGAIVYESPLLGTVSPGGRFPVCIVWNAGSRKAGTREALRATQAWKAGGRSVLEFEGSGGHTRYVDRRSTFNKAHNWNQSLNARLGWEVNKWLCREDYF